jgi:hypothetical protein
MASGSIGREIRISQDGPSCGGRTMVRAPFYCGLTPHREVAIPGERTRVRGECRNRSACMVVESTGKAEDS